MEAGRRTINDILNGNRQLEIPFFQRAYVWDEEQWDRFLDDMKYVSQTGNNYFLGPVILKQQPTNANADIGDVRTLIDGQQRLTTLALFFKALCLKTGEEFSSTFTLRQQPDTLAVVHNHVNRRSFEAVLRLKPGEDIGDAGDDKILQAYNFFRDNIVKGEIKGQSVLNNLIFVGVDLASDEDEQQVFDTLNSLGVRLTAAELLKNYFFGRDDLEFYNEFWKSVFEKDEETKAYWDREVTTGRISRTFIDLFFHAYLQIRVQQSSVENKRDYGKLEKLFGSYKRFIDYLVRDRGEYGRALLTVKKEIVSDIKEYALQFRDNFNPDVTESHLTSEFGIERINAIIFGMENSTLVPYVLFILKNEQDERRRNQLFAALEAYIVRRVVAKASNKNYNLLFSGTLISKNIRSAEEFGCYIREDAEEANYLPDDNDVQAGFKQSRLVNKQAAGILYLMESKMRVEGKAATALLGIGQYSLEHLMPKKWENHWSIPPSLTKEERDKTLLTLGNLAIIPQRLNATMRDSAWVSKRNHLLQHAPGIQTLSPYLEKSDWNETEIGNRAEWLCEMFLKTWKVG